MNCTYIIYKDLFFVVYKEVYQPKKLNVGEDLFVKIFIVI